MILGYIQKFPKFHEFKWTHWTHYYDGPVYICTVKVSWPPYIAPFVATCKLCIHIWGHFEHFPEAEVVTVARVTLSILQMLDIFFLLFFWALFRFYCSCRFEFCWFIAWNSDSILALLEKFHKLNGASKFQISGYFLILSLFTHSVPVLRH